MKKLILPMLLIGFLLIAFLVCAWGWVFFVQTPLSSDKSLKRFVITKGEGVGQVAKSLEEEGLIRSNLGFRFYVQLNNLSGKIPAGEFMLSASLNIPQIIQQLLAGPTQVWVTIPEGLRREQVPSRFTDAFGLTGQQKLDFENTFMRDTIQLEGYLYPETYLFPKQATSGAVIKRLRATFDQKVKVVYTPDTIILASILERETKDVKTEGPVVAGILLKRIKAGWPLQADATVQYAIGTPSNWWPTPTLEDLKVNSPYNTYKISGLPPAPIASPSVAAITAAANSVESDYWYYIHGNDGQIYYAETLEEHNQNIAKHLR